MNELREMRVESEPLKLGRGPRLALLVLIIVVLSLLAAATITTLILWAFGDWARYEFGLKLTLKIMWGTWLVLLAGTLLTWVTIIGWKFRRLAPGQGPMALLRAIAAGDEPAARAKTGWTSFTITVVVVSLTGTAILAEILLWIIGDWEKDGEVLGRTARLIGGAWWVLLIAAVLVRVAIFGKQKKNRHRPPDNKDNKNDPNSGNP